LPTAVIVRLEYAKGCILIDQYSIHVEQYYKTESNQWIFSEKDGEESILKFNKIPFEIVLADIYNKVDFDAE
jgi:hypothetical protein